jgi:hypothetical protein
MYLPGSDNILMPFDEAREVWRAYNAGAEAWSACLAELEPRLTLKAFEALSRVPALERKTLLQSSEPLLRLVPDDGDDAALNPQEEWLLNELSSLNRQLMDLAIARGLVDPGSPGSSDGDDAA